MTDSIVPHAELDITAETCPMTYVRTRLALDALESGAILQIRLRGADPARNVPRTAQLQGHTVLSETAMADGVTVVVLQRR
jgi:tRNA 2-thiouridine synthesizing protein A